MNLRLGAYRLATSAARPLVPLILGYRERQGKEEVTRIGERYGIASIARPEGRLVWVHAASVGETNAVLPLMQALEARQPDLSFLLTTGTVTSATMAGQRLGARALHQYAPLDSIAYVRRFLAHWRPDVAVLTESEIWPNLVLETASRGVPLVLVNGRLSDASCNRWRRSPETARAVFGRFQLVLAQNDRMRARFGELGAPVVASVGNLKADAPPLPVDRDAFASLDRLLAGRPRLVAASTHPGEDEIIAIAHRQLRQRLPGLCTIIVPRHPERGAAIAGLCRSAGLAVRRRSQGEMPDPNCEVYAADTIGELGTFYALSPVAVIGGSLVDKGGQNPIEAVRQGAAVLSGPHVRNFADIFAALIEQGAATTVRTPDEITTAAHRLLADPAALATVRGRADVALAGLTGALARSVEALSALLPVPEAGTRARA